MYSPEWGTKLPHFLCFEHRAVDAGYVGSDPHHLVALSNHGSTVGPSALLCLNREKQHSDSCSFGSFLSIVLLSPPTDQEDNWLQITQLLSSHDTPRIRCDSVLGSWYVAY